MLLNLILETEKKHNLHTMPCYFRAKHHINSVTITLYTVTVYTLSLTLHLNVMHRKYILLGSHHARLVWNTFYHTNHQVTWVPVPALFSVSRNCHTL